MDGRDCNLGGRGEEVGNGKTTIIKYSRRDEGGQFLLLLGNIHYPTLNSYYTTLSGFPRRPTTTSIRMNERQYVMGHLSTVIDKKGLKFIHRPTIPMLIVVYDYYSNRMSCATFYWK